MMRCFAWFGFGMVLLGMSLSVFAQDDYCLQEGLHCRHRFGRQGPQAVLWRNSFGMGQEVKGWQAGTFNRESCEWGEVFYNRFA